VARHDTGIGKNADATAALPGLVARIAHRGERAARHRITRLRHVRLRISGLCIFGLRIMPRSIRRNAVAVPVQGRVGGRRSVVRGRVAGDHAIGSSRIFRRSGIGGFQGRQIPHP
jgi:hypothetical protein